ncbi:GNAT family N-acetyltransferase [Streptacidiphilus jiangxiensis]|uniref:Ribosomal protein S18 acetylase RimI n=1 Tax=Streptacidiphilus jiangxiensis TaxID=235985 RepID=A0A1H7ZNF3_STRJI|nr:GNAT family N-acetyltransferase [Streptacidiphilus jiangxiensis]SEM58977.1 Ribosomal protein S18 acetylase RimI [Streptacidiphilus jiangxiensis]
MPADIAQLIRRPIAPTDAAPLAELLNAIEVVDVFGEYYSEEDATDQINDPVLDLERGTVGVFDGDRMVGFSSAAHKLHVEDVHRVTVSGGVHPKYRRRGLGAELLAAGVASAEALHAIHHPDLPLAVDVQNNALNDGARACYQAAGMTPVRWYSHLRHPLGAAVVDLPLPDGLVLESHSVDNDADFFAVWSDAVLDRWGGVPPQLEQWRAFLGWSAFCPDLSFLLRDVDSGTAAGMLLTFSWDADTAATGVRDANVQRIGTRRAYRRRGVASALIGQVLRVARDAGFDGVNIEVDADSPSGSNGLYERAGFTMDRAEVRYSLNP